MSGDIHALSGAYVVDAVDNFERAQFERHLTGCDDCRLEVASLREAAGLLADTVAQPAPDALRANILSSIEMVRPLPPLVVGAQDRARAHRRRVPTLLAAAAALVVMGGVGATVWHPWEQPTTNLSASQLANAPDTEVMTQELAGGGSITLTRSASLNSAVVTTHNMPRLQSGKTYQLWSIHDGTPVSAGVFGGDTSDVIVGADPGLAQAVAITIEPKPKGDETPVDAPTSDFIVASFDFTEA